MKVPETHMKLRHITISQGDTSNRCVAYHSKVLMDLQGDESLQFTTWVPPLMDAKLPYPKHHIAECILNRFRMIIRQLNQPQATLEMMCHINTSENTVNAITDKIDLDYLIHKLTQ